MNETKRFLLARRRLPRGIKLSRFDVEDMRRWARTTGFGLPLPTQVHCLRAEWPGVSYSSIREILENHSWVDPTYQRLTPLPGESVVPQQMGLFAALFLMLQFFVGEAPCSRSPSTAR